MAQLSATPAQGCIAGNHDLLLDAAFVDQFPNRIFERPGTSRADLRFGSLIYLCNSQTTINIQGKGQVKIYGSPLTPSFGTWAYQYPPIRDVWEGTVPEDTDVLVTHGPPILHNDFVKSRHAGCPHLLREVQRVRPALHIYGHIHDGRGTSQVVFDKVQCIFERMSLGEVSVSLLVKLMIAWLKNVCGIEKDSGKTTVMVNAAVVHGVDNSQVHSPTVVQI